MRPEAASLNDIQALLYQLNLPAEARICDEARFYSIEILHHRTTRRDKLWKRFWEMKPAGLRVYFKQVSHQTLRELRRERLRQEFKDFLNMEVVDGREERAESLQAGADEPGCP